MYPNMINELVAYQTSLGEHYVPRRKPCSRYTKKRSAGPSSNWRIKMFVSSERPSSLGKTTLKPYQVRDQLGLDTVGGDTRENHASPRIHHHDPSSKSGSCDSSFLKCSGAAGLLNASKKRQKYLPNLQAFVPQRVGFSGDPGHMDDAY